ncbi:MAG: sulfotransferase domain-containing protein [Cocleimonas sp.]|nr:sulfotransferase domain-containing protein [Cocleimonas sp.]
MKSNTKQGERERPVVDFLIAGAQKSGTTTLHSYLQDHPEIGMASKKEVHFFNNNTYFEVTNVDYSIYHSFFDLNASKKMRGEVTPAYMFCRDAPRRIWQYNPDMKIILILRNPIDRAFSHWNMEVARGAESLLFSVAIKRELERCREALPDQHYVYSYLDRGFYSSQIRELRRFFKKDQVLILKHDDLKQKPNIVIGKIFDFLRVLNLSEISPAIFNEKVLNRAKYSTELSQEDKFFLVQYYKFEIQQLESLLAWDCSEWLE